MTTEPYDHDYWGEGGIDLSRWGDECKRAFRGPDSNARRCERALKRRRRRKPSPPDALFTADGKPIFGTRGVRSPEAPPKRWGKQKPKPVRVEPLWDVEPIRAASEEGGKLWTKKAPA
jgi:hypothetical protein